MAKVTLQDINKSFPQRGGNSKGDVIKVLHQIDLDIKDGEFMVLVGPSGCGKSTLLRMIAGLETATSGDIWVGENNVTQLPPKQRDIAMVFQNYALYPHLNVYDNIAFGLRRMSQGGKEGNKSALPGELKKGLMGLTRAFPKPFRYHSATETSINQKVHQVAQLLQLEALLNRLPKDLSGGQKQRVALGRAIARNPQVFLMDEPMSNLDAALRGQTRSQIVQLQRKLGITTIYVTHDQIEAMTMGERIAVMNQGKIQQVASPLELYHHPANCFVAGFIGTPSMNFLPVKIENFSQISYRNFSLIIPPTWKPYLQKHNKKSAILGIRPEHITVENSNTEHLQVKVNLVENLGNEIYLFTETLDETRSQIIVRLSGEKLIKIGEKIGLSFNAEKIHLFDSQTEQSLL
ncbi:ABC transporter ATP-binding protein [Cyanothece sp. BG0011]|uniref:ABC transporter ATP-binding protein n=1 Tax=Cyanothece sp. BG0011 TaxID=2082950 RepID=UPI000D1F8AF1|nr:ABC transporter ATP-binding protein [Cyanothece sp. BG0011]